MSKIMKLFKDETLIKPVNYKEEADRYFNENI